MDNLKEFLNSIGLGKNETEIYIALVHMGTSSVLEISKKTGIHRSNIYEALRNLVKEGLIFEINNPTKLFYARSPRGLISYLKHKEIELNEIIKELEMKTMRKDVREKIKITKGIFALKEAIYSLLDTHEDIRVYGIPKKAPEVIGPVIEDFHKERIKKKIPMLHIYNSDGAERARNLSRRKYTDAKILPKKYDSFVTTNISGNKIVLFLWEDEITVIEIEDENMSRPYREYFHILWNKARRPQ